MTLLIFSCVLQSSALPPNSGKILSINEGVAYIALGELKVQKGALLEVFDSVNEPVGMLVVETTFKNYSAATALPGTDIENLKKGMTAVVYANDDREELVNPPSPSKNISDEQPVKLPSFTDSRASVIVPPAQVNDVVGVGHFGGYVADLLMEQLMMCPKVKLIDRSLFGAQLDEVAMGGEFIDPSTAIEKGKIAGVRYAVQVTMQKPDVTNVRTGIPLASIMGALQGGLNRNIGAQYMSNMEIARLKASVSLSARVIDLQTGEVLFMTSGNGKAEGDAQIGMEYGALGGAKLNDGADGFKQTVTGKAIQKAFMTIGRNLDAFFSGNATSKVMGSASGFGRFDDKLERRGMSLYSGINKLSTDDLESLFYENKNLWFKYKSAKKQLKWSNVINGFGVAALGGAVCFFVWASAGDQASEPWGPVCLGVALTSITSGIIMNISAHRKVESIKNAYNDSINKRTSGYGNYSLDLVTSPINGIGLRFTF